MNNNVIRSDDPKAIEKLTEKLESCQKQQEFMKTVNSYYRKKRYSTWLSQRIRFTS